MDTFVTIFTDLVETFEVVETVAGRLFGVMREKEIDDIDGLNAEITATYVQLGYSQTKGRPKAGATETPAPDIIQTYVSRLRRGLKLGLDVKTFETMYQLQEAIRKFDVYGVAVGPERLPELKGVTIANEDRLTGAFCHDIVVYVKKLPDDKRVEMEEKIRKVMKRYERFVYRAIAEEETKAA